MNLLICSPSTFSTIFERLCEDHEGACSLVEAFEDGLLSDHQLPDGTLVINPQEDWPLHRILTSIRKVAPTSLIAGAYLDASVDSVLSDDQIEKWVARTVAGRGLAPESWADDFETLRLDDGGSPAEVRQWVVERLDDWGLDDLTMDAALVASELTTNALTSRNDWQANDPIDVELARLDQTALLSVIDTTPDLPTPLPLADARISGRGLHIVSELAQWWGVTSWDASKVVWAELAA